MEHRFMVQAGGREFRLNSMNVKTLGLFQIYLMDNGKEKRYHLKSEGAQFTFAMRSDIPKELLELEQELSKAICKHYGLVQQQDY